LLLLNILSYLWRVDGVEFAKETGSGSDLDRVWDLRWDLIERVFKTMTRQEG